MGRSVHSWGMREAVAWSALDARGAVLAVGVLRPGRIAVGPRGTRWMLEVLEPPPPGAVLAATPMLAGWPDD